MLKIIVQGEPNSGKTTTAQLIKNTLKEFGYRDVQLVDLPPSTDDKRKDWEARIARTLAQPVRIHVEQVKAQLSEPPPAPEPTGPPHVAKTESGGPCKNCGAMPDKWAISPVCRGGSK